MPCSVALLALSQHPVYSKRWGVPLIIGGGLLFSGSIFGLLLFGKERCASTHWAEELRLISVVPHRVRFLGPVTPLGGLLMIAGSVAGLAN